MSLGVAHSDDQARTSELRALAHPLRLRILSLLTGAAMSAAEVARELDLTHANASYHLRQLHAAGAIEVTGEERIRGGRARRYSYDDTRHVARIRERFRDGGLPPPDARLLIAAHASELRRRAAHLLLGPGTQLTDAELWIDHGAYDEVRTLLAQASALLHQAARPPRTPGTTHVSASIALFRMEPDDA